MPRSYLASTAVRDAIVWARHLTLRPEDFIFASYPRTGSTWLRFLASQLFFGEESTFERVNRNIPDLSVFSRPPVLSGGQRLIKSHEQWHPTYSRCLYLYRDPWSVYRSEYLFQLRVGRFRGDPDQFLDHFLQGNQSRYGSWGEHARSFLAAPSEPIFVSFQTLREHTDKVLERIAGSLRTPVSPEQVKAVISSNTKERMKEKEDSSASLPSSGGSKFRFIGATPPPDLEEDLRKNVEAVRETFGGVFRQLHDRSFVT